MMDGFFLFMAMLLAFFGAFNAGRLDAMTDVDKIDGVKTSKWLYFWKWSSILSSIYFIIAVYGHGLHRGIA